MVHLCMFFGYYDDFLYIAFILGQAGFTDAGLKRLASLPLPTLALDYCQNISGNGLEHLKALTNLSLNECDGITNGGLSNLNQLPLKKLVVSLCKNVTDQNR